MRLEFTLPLPPNFSNDGRVHWSKKHRAQSTYIDQCDMHLLLKQIPPPPERPFQRVRISAHLYVGNHMDDDNAMIRLKWVIDWLRTRRYIADDRRTNIEWASLPAQTIDRKRPRLVLVIEDVSLTGAGG